MSNQQAVSISKALWLGFLGRCPNCGEGRLFARFLKVKDACEACGEEFHHHRADDFPAYLVIVVVGHIIVPMVLSVETHYAPPYWMHLALWLPLTLGLSLGLLGWWWRCSGLRECTGLRQRSGNARPRPLTNL
jgi:uncharacterized protein (DUF983 family)